MQFIIYCSILEHNSFCDNQTVKTCIKFKWAPIPVEEKIFYFIFLVRYLAGIFFYFFILVADSSLMVNLGKWGLISARDASNVAEI